MPEPIESPHKGHCVTINNRSRTRITGVLDVISFDTEEIVLETEEGRMQIMGSALQVKQLAIESGTVEIEGRPDTIQYSEIRKSGTNNGSVLSRFFR